jgi:hypothetical protein
MPPTLWGHKNRGKESVSLKCNQFQKDTINNKIITVHRLGTARG